MVTNPTHGEFSLSVVAAVHPTGLISVFTTRGCLGTQVTTGVQFIDVDFKLALRRGDKSLGQPTSIFSILSDEVAPFDNEVGT